MRFGAAASGGAPVMSWEQQLQQQLQLQLQQKQQQQQQWEQQQLAVHKLHSSTPGSSSNSGGSSSDLSSSGLLVAGAVALGIGFVIFGLKGKGRAPGPALSGYRQRRRHR